MSKKATVRSCNPKMVKTATIGNATVAPVSAPVHPSGDLAQCIDNSEINRKKLQTWSESSKYKSISFWIQPNVIVTPDECIAEVANALTRFDEEKKAGTVKPVGDDVDKL